MPSHHRVLQAHIPWLVSSTWDAAFWALCRQKLSPAVPHCTPQPEPALARTHPSVSNSTAGLQSWAGLSGHCGCPHLGTLAAAPVQRAQAAPPPLPLPKLEIYGGASPRMDAVFGLFLHHPHCPRDDSRCPCGHQKSLAGEITAHLHFSPRETRTSSITDSRAAVTSTQTGVNTMQPASDLQIIT